MIQPNGRRQYLILVKLYLGMQVYSAQRRLLVSLKYHDAVILGLKNERLEKSSNEYLPIDYYDCSLFTLEFFRIDFSGLPDCRITGFPPSITVHKS